MSTSSPNRRSLPGMGFSPVLAIDHFSLRPSLPSSLHPFIPLSLHPFILFSLSPLSFLTTFTRVSAMADAPLTPIAPARAAQELAKLASARKSGELKQNEYEHKFSRMISELRDRRISGT